MSGLNLVQVYAANPITSNTNTDLMYFEQGGLDSGMQYQNFIALNATNAAKGSTISIGTNAEFYPLFVASTTNGNQVFNLNSGIHYNPSTATLTTTTFSGALSGNASTATSVALSGITGLGTGVATALAINIGSVGAPILFNGAGGTPSSMVGTNITGTAAGLTAGTASAVAVGGITGLGTGVATALAINIGSAGAFITFNGSGGTPSSMTGTNISGTASGLTSGQASALVGNTPSYLSNASVGNSVSGSTGNYQSGAAHITLTQGTWRCKMYAIMNFGASTVNCAVSYLSGFFGADGANNATPPTAISSTTTGPLTYNALSGNATYNPMPTQTNTGNYILFPLECYVTVASGTQAVYAVLSVSWVTSTTLLWGSFIEAYKVSN